MQTLFITRYPPYPPMGGAALRNWQNINLMKKYGPVSIFSICSNDVEASPLPEIIFWKHYKTNGPLSRWEKLERQFWPLRPLAYPSVDELYESKAAQKLEEILRELKPDLVIFEELWLYRYLKIVQRHSRHIIFDNHNIEADLLEQTHGSLKLKLPRLKAIERDFINKSDQVWVCSDEDSQLIEKLYGNSSRIYQIPNGIDVSSYHTVYHHQYDYPRYLEPTHHNILFLGQYNYPPNRIAAKILIEQIYPQLKQSYSDCRLLLVGRNPNPFMLEASQKNSDIIVTGSIPDVRPYLAAASMMVVPLQQGGGTRLKILEAFASGCPVISTKKGAEGLGVKDRIHVLFKENSQEIIEGVHELWSNSSFSTTLVKNAYELVKSSYSWESTATRLDSIMQSMLRIGV